MWPSKHIKQQKIHRNYDHAIIYIYTKKDLTIRKAAFNKINVDVDGANENRRNIFRPLSSALLVK